MVMSYGMYYHTSYPVFITHVTSNLRKASTVWFLQFTAELMSKRTSTAHEEAFNLYRDWMSARARLWGEIVCKLAYFHQLPWCLVGMSHREKHRATLAAQHCLNMYSRGGPGVWHRQSQRFLSPTFEALLKTLLYCLM